jgi:hypothetical protein
MSVTSLSASTSASVSVTSGFSIRISMNFNVVMRVHYRLFFVITNLFLYHIYLIFPPSIFLT